MGGSMFLTPSGDTTGATDAVAISSAFSSGYGEVVLLPGTFYINSTITIPGDCTLSGSGTCTILRPAAGITGPMIEFSGYNTMARDVQVDGGGSTTSSNPAADVFSPAPGAARWWLQNVDVNYCNGWVLNPAPVTGPLHGSVQSVQGTNNAGGIRISGGTSTGGQVNISDVNLQSCQASEALYLSDITDVSVSDFNASVAGAARVPAVHLSGSCQAVMMRGMNAGVTGTPTAGVGVLLVEASGSSSPTEIDISGSVFQAGGVGVIVNGTSARLRFRGVMAKNNQGDGWQFNGTGAAILIDGCQAHTNNQAAGTAYDVRVTSTAHVGLFSFAYCSAGVTNSRNITSASNHVSDVNPTNPAGRPTTGQPPNGW